MSLWNDPPRWDALCSGAACPICLRGEPLDLLATFDGSWLTMQESAPVRGYVCLVSRIHAVELHHLPEPAALSLMRDARRVSRALAAVTGAVKLNYEIHGNSLPHLHIHFFPRYPGDPFEGQPINPRLARQPVYAPGEFAALRVALATALGCANFTPMNALFQKLNFKGHKAIHILNAPESFQAAMEEMRPLTSVQTTLARAKDVQFALAFATKKAEVDKFADQVAKASAGDAVIWIAYPKGTSKKYKCEFNRDNGWDRLGSHGFEPVRMVAIDEDWSALRFRRVEHIKTMTRSFALTEAGKAKAAKS